MSNPFEYRQPSQSEVGYMREINQHIEAAYNSLIDLVDPSAERALAVRKLQEARMWANVAILGIGL